MYLQYLLSHWANVRASLIATLVKFRYDELAFRPFSTSWPVRQLMLHIAQEENGELNYGITKTLAEFPVDYSSQDYPTVASIQALLASVHSSTLAYLKSIADADLSQVIVTPWGQSCPLIEMLGHLIEHEIHHRAELSLILGMLGREGLNA